MKFKIRLTILLGVFAFVLLVISNCCPDNSWMEKLSSFVVDAATALFIASLLSTIAYYKKTQRQVVINMIKSLTGFLLAVLCCLTACKKVTKQSNSEKNISFKKVKLVDTTEYLDWHTVKIDGSIHTVSTTRLLYKILGKPDSIVKTNNECEAAYFENISKYIYIKGNQFELSGDSIAVAILDFQKSGIKIVSNGLTLDSTTTLTSLKKIYPIAVKNQYNTNDGAAIITRVILGTDKTYIQGDTDGVWILSFKNKKLTSIDYHLDC